MFKLVISLELKTCLRTHIKTLARVPFHFKHFVPILGGNNFVFKMTQVKKRISKKTKGSWRKIEHQDVENYLEDQRLEERMG